MSVWGTSPPHILHIHLLHQVATSTPSHDSLWRRGIIIAIFRGFGTKCMVPSDWDLVPKCVCDPNFISYLIGEPPILSAASIDFRVNLIYMWSSTNITIDVQFTTSHILHSMWNKFHISHYNNVLDESARPIWKAYLEFIQVVCYDTASPWQWPHPRCDLASCRPTSPCDIQLQTLNVSQ